jgi:phospholipid transport system transporter-binding protein
MAERSPGEPEPELVLSGPITSEAAPELKQRLLAHLDAGAPCRIHAHAVSQLDGAGAQLLYAFVQEAARRGAEVRWVSASVPLSEAAAMLGMTACLGLTEEARAWRA